MFKIIFKQAASKELEKLPNNIILKIVEAIMNLANYPKPNGCKKLKGKTEDLYRIRIGDYRVIYSIESLIKIIEIRKVGHRKDIYT
jgi:mRNA interferase RelE/StbE